MRTRSEWFLGARGGSLELSPENLRPPTSNMTAGTIGSYNRRNNNYNNQIFLSASSSNRPSSYRTNIEHDHHNNNSVLMIFFSVLDFLF